jgi:hypothetical protein
MGIIPKQSQQQSNSLNSITSTYHKYLAPKKRYLVEVGLRPQNAI